MADLGDPLVADVVEGVGVHHGEHGKEHVGLRVGERTETIIVFLTYQREDAVRNYWAARGVEEWVVSTGSVPEGQADGLAIDAQIARIRVEHRWDIVRRETVAGIGEQSASLANSTVTNNDKLHVLHDNRESVSWEKRKKFFKMLKKRMNGGESRRMDSEATETESSNGVFRSLESFLTANARAPSELYSLRCIIAF